MVTSVLLRAGNAAHATVSTVRWTRRDAAGVRLARSVRSERLTFLGVEPLLELRARILDAEKDGVPGALVETGCALGGSAIVMAQSRRSDRPVYVYDVFGMIPPPTDADGPD